MNTLHEVEVIYKKTTPTTLCVLTDEDAVEVWIARRDCQLRPRDPDRGLVKGEVAILTAYENVLIEKGLV